MKIRKMRYLLFADSAMHLFHASLVLQPAHPWLTSSAFYISFGCRLSEIAAGKQNPVQDVAYNQKRFSGLPGAPVKKITLSRRVGFVRFRYPRRGTKWPSVGECPVPFVFATCLKTSPSCCTRLLLFPCACVFTKRKRTRAMDAVETGRDARSFDSTTFLPIRQTFDSFTWEPQNSSWWLSSLLSLSRSLFLIQLHGARLGVRYTFRGHRCSSICPLQNLPSACF